MSKNPETRRRRGPPGGSPAVTDAPLDAATADSARAAPTLPASAGEIAPPVRPPMDLEALAKIGRADRAEIDALMAEFGAGGPRRAWQAGDRVRGTITMLGADFAFVDLGGKADGVIDRLDLGDPPVGAIVDLFVLSTRDGEIRLTRTPRGEAARDMLDDARRERTPVTGKVVGANEHGVEVVLGDDVKAFCPVGQLDVEGAADPKALVGRSLPFRILDLRGRDVLVSRRALVEDAERAAQKTALASFREGDVLDGVVTRTAQFGVFVKVPPGFEGLVPTGQLSKAPGAAAPKEGDAIRVRVLAVDLQRQRLTLSAKAAADAISAAEGSQSRGGFDVFASLLQGVQVRR
jgi:small subunit ribosomal protein S1